MKLILSNRIARQYWIANAETDEFVKEGFPIFTQNDVLFIKKTNITNDALEKIWQMKMQEKISAEAAFNNLKLKDEKESWTDAYKVPTKPSALTPAANECLQHVFKILSNKTA